VIVGNPPYSAGQESANDNNQNLRYPQLDAKIRATYAARSTGQNLNSLYDSYIRAIRWASDRIGDHGVIAFVTNAGFIDGNAMEGIRATLTEEFSSIWVFNARGNARTSGEFRQKEKGNVFGGGTRTPIALTILAKTQNHAGNCEVHYHDIGDYLSRDQKLEIIRDAKSLESVAWSRIAPNEQHDWINQRDPAFEKFPGMGERWSETDAFFEFRSRGLESNRDAWVYNFGEAPLISNVHRFISTFNDSQAKWTVEKRSLSPETNPLDGVVTTDPVMIKWSRGMRNDLVKGKTLSFDDTSITRSMYRPFAKQHLHFSRQMNEYVNQMPRLFPTPDAENQVIYISGPGDSKPPAALLVDCVPDLNMQHSGGQAFPLYWFEDTLKSSDPSRPTLSGLDQSGAPGRYRRHDGINTFMLEQYLRVYGDPSITKEDIFYYVYGVLHSPEYRTRFESDLKKMLPRIPFTEDFWAFSLAGRELGELHVGYESVEPWPVTETRKQMPFTSDGQQLDDQALYRVEKMRFGKDGKAVDKSVIVYNPHFTLSDIPFGAYDYIVNGKSALDWIMERYAITQDKESKIVNDPNEWSDDPRYIVDLVKRIVRVSIETNRIVASLPPLNERDVEPMLSVNSFQTASSK
jgi:predicted helicase